MGTLVEIMERLAQLGYALSVEEENTLFHLLAQATHTVCGMCNTETVPEALEGVVTDMVCGLFLLEAKVVHPEKMPLDLGLIEKEVQEGDTTVRFAIDGEHLTPEKRLDALLLRMAHPPASVFVPFRRIAW